MSSLGAQHIKYRLPPVLANKLFISINILNAALPWVLHTFSCFFLQKLQSVVSYIFLRRCRLVHIKTPLAGLVVIRYTEVTLRRLDIKIWELRAQMAAIPSLRVC